MSKLFSRKKANGEQVEENIISKKQKAPKKKVVRRIVVGVIVVAIVGSIAVNAMNGKNMKMPVETTTVELGDITQTLDTSGIVESDEVKTYFSKVTGSVKSVSLEEGMDVDSNQLLLEYDTEQLEKETNMEQLEKKASGYGIDATITSLTDAQQKAAQAKVDYEDAVKYVNHYSDCVNQVKDQIVEAQKAAANVETLAAEVKAAAESLAAKPNSEKRAEKLAEKEKALKKAQKEVAKYNLSELNHSLELNSADLASYQALKAEYEVKKESDPSFSQQKSQQALLKELNSQLQEDATTDLEKARAGVSSEFKGIVTSIGVVEGQAVTAGMELFTIANKENIKMVIDLSKYDLEKIELDQPASITINGKQYEGNVSKIYGFAHTNQSGASVVTAEIRVNNPDDKIILGVEGKVSVTTATKKKILVVPVECVNSDTKGDFCYVVENGVVVRKEVELGVSSDEIIEIISGLSEKDQVITSVSSAIVEGIEVEAVPSKNTSGDASGDAMVEAVDENATE